jgi:tyrosine-protein phosphatase SIW14
MKTPWCALLLAICVSARPDALHVDRIDAHVYRAKQPDEKDFAGLARMGIKTVLDLRGGMIHEPKERKWVEAAGMRYVSIRLSGLFPPKEQQMAAILALLENPAQGPVFVHCRRGDDRTGIVIACYRIAHDHWTNERALEEARRDGISRFEPLMQRYIRRFNASKLPVATPARASTGGN